jgi:hypothetical protein
MAAKKKPKTKAKPKRPAPKPKAKAKPARKAASKPVAKKVQPKAKAAPKKASARPVVAKLQPKAKSAKATPPEVKAPDVKPVELPKPVTVAAPPAPSPTLVRPGLQKRADVAPIGVVRVMEGYQLIEESTFYSTAGRDEYVQRWEARGYTCRFTPTYA